MKKLLLSVFALAALSLLAPSTGFAYENQVGFYTGLDNIDPNLTDYNVGVPYFIYVMLHEPVNNDGATVGNLGGFEFITVLPADSFVLGVTYPVSALNVGVAPGEYIVGYSVPSPVAASGPTLLATFQVLSATTADQFFYVTPTNNPGIADNIAYLDKDADQIVAMHNSVGGNIADPIFVINPTELLVSVDVVSLDAVKALYR
jgi:hypothetical protein